MRLLFAAPTGNWAGTEEMVLRMATTSARSCDVCVVLAAGPNVSEHEIRSKFPPGVSVIVKGQQESLGEVAARTITTWGSPDIVHAHLRPGLNLAWRFRDLCPVIGHLHVRYFAAQFWWVDAVVCVSPWQTRDIPADFRGAVYLVPNSIGPPPERDADLVNAVGALLHRVPESVVFGGIGRLSPEKGFDVLIRGFRIAARAADRLILVGNGSEEEALRELAGDDTRILMPGYVPDARQILELIDVYASPSRLDSFGLSILEAMVAGKHVVSTAARGPADLLKQQPAIITPIDDIPTFADALSSAAEAVRAGEPSPDYDLSSYDADRCAAALDDVYSHVLGASTTSSLVRQGLTATGT